MTLIIVLNALFCLGVVLMVASPLVWAIFTQHRDHAAIEHQWRRAAAHRRRPAPRTQRAPVRARPVHTAA